MLHVRGILGMGAILSLFFTIKYLPVADAVVFSFLAPVIVTAAAPYVLREDSGNQGLPILAATVGVLLVCQPSFLFGHARLNWIGVMCGGMYAATSASAQV